MRNAFERDADERYAESDGRIEMRLMRNGRNAIEFQWAVAIE
jgi:hypothetical protein